MIVTRQRPKKFAWGKVVLPVVAIAALIAALVWPPSHKVIFNGPLAPLWNGLGNVAGTAARPLTFVGQNQTIADRNREIRRLNDQLEQERQTIASRDADVQRLKNQVSSLQQAAGQRAQATPLPAPIAKASSAPGVGAPALGAPPAGEPADVARNAQYWSQMDAAQAAAIVQKMPEDYVAKVFAKMGADSVAEILAALPPATAARISQIRP